MSWKDYLVITLLSLAVLLVMMPFQTAPGYMDAEYYYGMGMRIAKFKEFSEPFVWNYLEEIQTIPHPGFSYWMPFPALLASLGMWITGVFKFSAARIGFVTVAVLVPAISMGLCYRLTGKSLISWFAGLLAVFPAFYNIFLTTTDSIGIMMSLGGIFLFVALGKKSSLSYLALGMVTGLLHLTRPDGLLWIAAGILLVLEDEQKIRSGALLTGGYLLVMGPWFARNYLVFGTILPGGSTQVLWLRDYDELFLFHVGKLNFEHWITQGWTQILGNISGSIWSNLKTLIFVQGQLVLFPLILLGLKKYWRIAAVKAVLLVWVLDFLLMSFVFPFAGMRGGFLHSGAGFQPLFWSLAASGFVALISIGVKKRGWTSPKAELLFGASLIVLLGLGSSYLYMERVVGSNPQQPVWSASERAAQEIGRTLQELELQGLVMINNPPGFFSATGRSAIVIPSGGVSETLQAANQFGANYLILEPNHASSLDDLYLHPEHHPNWEFIVEQGGIQYFKVVKD